MKTAAETLEEMPPTTGPHHGDMDEERAATFWNGLSPNEAADVLAICRKKG